MIKQGIKKLIKKENLRSEDTQSIMESIMEGETTPAQIASFVTALRMKGETIDEITGCATAMRNKAEKIELNLDYYIDTCGTGGDGSNTFNVSTAVAFVAASAGIYVAKHGNRSISSKCGSYDVLEALGISTFDNPQKVKECIENVGIGFMFAPCFHKSMKYAAGPRAEMGVRTVFNILGPLTNPAKANGQVVGVFDGDLTEVLANVLKNLGVEKAMVVHGNDGLDEITTTKTTKISEIKAGDVINYEISPNDYGIEFSNIDDLVGGDPNENAEIILDIFRGKKGAKRDMVVINAAAALYVGKKVNNMQEGVILANELIDSGKPLDKIAQMKEFTKEYK